MTSPLTNNPEIPSSPPPRLLAILREAKRVLIIGHQNPDGDALGSALALALALKALGGPESAKESGNSLGPGIEVIVGYNGAFPSSLDFLTQGKDFVRRVPFGHDLRERFDLMVLVDCLAPFRVWPEAEALPLDSFPPFVVIDHHSDPLKTSCLSSFVNHLASATAEQVFKVITDLGAEFTPPIVEALLAALISDTGSFSQANSTEECLRQAAFLVSKGGNIEYINHFLKRNWPVTRMRLLTQALATIDLHHQGRVATMVVTQEMLNQTGSCVAETDGFVEYPLLLNGVDMVAFCKVNGQGQTRVSLRSRPGLDVRELARSFGGGGHTQAAAYMDDNPNPLEALEKLLSRLGTFNLPEKTG
ncbi:MAG: DHH family phosphoesterase [Deltaproteobacteria bacterium]|jgi:phosphoesterase RecJ-like protein|nr:DHH family phosphoesterase [Deltaproteobacteria bacterium]